MLSTFLEITQTQKLKHPDIYLNKQKLKNCHKIKKNYQKSTHVCIKCQVFIFIGWWLTEKSTALWQKAMKIPRITIRRIAVLPKICSVEFMIRQISGSSKLMFCRISGLSNKRSVEWGSSSRARARSPAGLGLVSPAWLG